MPTAIEQKKILLVDKQQAFKNKNADIAVLQKKLYESTPYKSLIAAQEDQKKIRMEIIALEKEVFGE